MGKNIGTKLLNIAKTFNLNNKAAGFTIPGEYCHEWNLITDGITWLEKIYEKLGYKKISFPKTLQAWEDKTIHPLDRQRVKKAKAPALKNRGCFFYTLQGQTRKRGVYFSVLTGQSNYKQPGNTLQVGGERTVSF